MINGVRFDPVTIDAVPLLLRAHYIDMYRRHRLHSHNANNQFDYLVRYVDGSLPSDKYQSHGIAVLPAAANEITNLQNAHSAKMLFMTNVMTLLELRGWGLRAPDRELANDSMLGVP